MPTPALELLFDPATDERLRAEWALLATQGLPSQAHHQGLTNAPHVTVATPALLEPGLLHAAQREIAGGLPTVVHVEGLLLLGGGDRVTLARHVRLDGAVWRAIARVREVAGVSADFLPHVSLARRVRRDRLGDAVRVLGAGSDARLPGQLTSLRVWDPADAAVTVVAGAAAFTDVHRVDVAAPHDAVWTAVLSCAVRGWGTTDALWRVRAAADWMVGGVGLRRRRTRRLAGGDEGERRPLECWRPGDTVDFWRVEHVVPGHAVRLRADARLPGVARLSVTIDALDQRRCQLTVTTTFHPAGLAGRAFWLAELPAHSAVFARVARDIGRRAEGSRVSVRT